MKLDDFNSLNNNSQDKENFLMQFMKELQSNINDFFKNTPHTQSNIVSNDSLYIVRDINDNKLSLVNVDDGEEIDIYIVDSNNNLLENTYEMTEQDFYNLSLGSNVSIQNGKCTIYTGDVQIKSPELAAKLEDMYFCLDQEKNAIFSVSDIRNKKIYLTHIEEGGYFSIPQQAYPDFKIGDLVKKINNKYVLI